MLRKRSRGLTGETGHWGLNPHEQQHPKAYWAPWGQPHFTGPCVPFVVTARTFLGWDLNTHFKKETTVSEVVPISKEIWQIKNQYRYHNHVSKEVIKSHNSPVKDSLKTTTSKPENQSFSFGHSALIKKHLRLLVWLQSSTFKIKSVSIQKHTPHVVTDKSFCLEHNLSIGSQGAAKNKFELQTLCVYIVLKHLDKSSHF